MHRPRPARRAALRGLCRRRAVRDAVHPGRLRGRAARAARGGARGRPRVPRPRHLLDAGGRARARLLLFLRRGARHAHGPLRGSRCAHGRERVAGGAARPDLPPVRRGALRARHRTRDRAPPPAGADRDHDRAGRRDQARGPHAGAVRRRAPGATRVPGDPDRGQPRAGVPRARSARGMGAAAPGWPHGRDLLPLTRGPDGEALPRRSRPGLHLPAGPARLRMRARARGGADQPPRGAPEPGRGGRQPAGAVGAPARGAEACPRRGGRRRAENEGEGR